MVPATFYTILSGLFASAILTYAYHTRTVDLPNSVAKSKSSQLLFSSLPQSFSPFDHTLLPRLDRLCFPTTFRVTELGVER